ncbi:MAG: [protein-PII] uridylyltransferase [Acidimicrobiales bacterium]
MSGKGTPLLAPGAGLRGRAYVEANTDATDQWFRRVFDDALSATPGLTLAAVGGYGRRELCPRSDVDVLLLHDDLDDYAEAAEALWYPVWDRGLKMGYAVATVDQAVILATEELHWATSLLSSRLIAGDPELLDRLDERVRTVWATDSDRLLAELSRAVHERHDQHGDVAFQIEPNLKEGRGGLRDLHALRWAEHAAPGFVPADLDDLDRVAEPMLDARVELHRITGRSGDVLSLDTQDDVASSLGFPSGHELMVGISRVGRRLAWFSDEAWSRWERRTGRARFTALTAEPIATEFGLVDGRLELTDRVDPTTDPLLLLRFALTAARTERTMGRRSLARLVAVGVALPEPWPAEARRLLVELLLTGRPAIAVVEDLDHYHLMTRIIPEWEAVRCRPQHNVMHTYTVDRHLCEAAANAAALVERVERPDLLVLGALLHDIGKGYPGDHTEAGMDHIARIGARMGFPDDEVGVLVDLCRHHLLLPDIATRRDLADPGTISAVAAAVDNVEFLELLAALTEADSKATGPSAWGTWKAGLLRDLVDRTAYVLDGGAPTEIAGPDFPTDEIVELMRAGEPVLRGNGSTFTVVAPDRSALFSQMAGVLVVNGLEILDAVAYSGDDAAACQFTLQPPTAGVVDWDRITAMAEKALHGRVALTARVQQRAQTYARYRRRLSATPPREDVVVDNDISDVATVVEVHAADTVGLLYRVTQALAELRLDIRSAKVQTFGPQAVDSFYLCDRDGAKISDPELLTELALAIRHAIGEEQR